MSTSKIFFTSGNVQVDLLKGLLIDEKKDDQIPFPETDHEDHEPRADPRSSQQLTNQFKQPAVPEFIRNLHRNPPNPPSQDSSSSHIPYKLTPRKHFANSAQRKIYTNLFNNKPVTLTKMALVPPQVTQTFITETNTISSPSKIPKDLYATHKTPIVPTKHKTGKWGARMVDGEWVQTDFPSLTPFERSEVDSLNEAFDSLLLRRKNVLLLAEQKEIAEREAELELARIEALRIKRLDSPSLLSPSPSSSSFSSTPPKTVDEIKIHSTAEQRQVMMAIMHQQNKNLNIIKAAAKLDEIVFAVNEETDMYDLVFHELIRQESIHCKERADLLTKVRVEYQDMTKRIVKNTYEARDLVNMQKVSERSERALRKTEYTRDESREMATDIIATSTTKLTHSILLTRFTRFALASLKMRLASLGAGRHAQSPEPSPGSPEGSIDVAGKLQVRRG